MRPRTSVHVRSHVPGIGRSRRSGTRRAGSHSEAVERPHDHAVVARILDAVAPPGTLHKVSRESDIFRFLQDVVHDMFMCGAAHVCRSLPGGWLDASSFYIDFRTISCRDFAAIAGRTRDGQYACRPPRLVQMALRAKGPDEWLWPENADSAGLIESTFVECYLEPVAIDGIQQPQQRYPLPGMLLPPDSLSDVTAYWVDGAYDHGLASITNMVCTQGYLFRDMVCRSPMFARAVASLVPLKAFRAALELAAADFMYRLIPDFAQVVYMHLERAADEMRNAYSQEIVSASISFFPLPLVRLTASFCI